MYGLCVDGDLHEIRAEYRQKIRENKSIFRSYMFHQAITKETDITAEKFITLPPTACPATTILPFQEQSRSQIDSWKRLKEKLPEEPINPFNGEFDSRTAVEFLYSFENHIDRRMETKDISKYYLFDLIEDVLATQFEEITVMTYEDLRDDFLSKFWSIQEQFKLYSKFLKSSHPMYPRQKVSEYVYLWINRFRHNTIILSQDFVAKLMNRIPVRYAFQLVKLNRGADWSQIFEVVESCELDLIDINRNKKRESRFGEHKENVNDWWD